MLQDGKRAGRFNGAAGEHRVTAACFDHNQRRLVTTATDGSVKTWNFNNGALLRQYKHDGPQARTKTLLGSLQRSNCSSC